MSAIEWAWYDFKELSNYQLYNLLKLRQEVFVVEQSEVYSDIDGIDISAKHLLGFHNNEIVCYLRLIKSKEDIIFGRVLVRKEFRGKGLGHALLEEAIRHLREANFKGAVKIASLAHVTNFYAKYGFEKINSSALSNDDEDVEMRLTI